MQVRLASLKVLMGICGSQREASKIAKITPAGIITEYPTLSNNTSPMNITLGFDGNLWFTAPGTNSIGTFSDFVFPPYSFKGHQKKNDFACIYEFYNALHWETPQFVAAGYFIYRNGRLIAKLEPNTVKFKDHNRAKDNPDTYTITAFNVFGMESSLSTITVP